MSALLEWLGLLGVLFVPFTVPAVYFEINYLLVKRSPRWPALEGGLVGLTVLTILSRAYGTADMSGEAAILADLFFTCAAVLLLVPPVLVGMSYQTRKCSAFNRKASKDHRQKIKLSRILRMTGCGGGAVVLGHGLLLVSMPMMRSNATDLAMAVAVLSAGALLMAFSGRSLLRKARESRAVAARRERERA